ncbi:hypothetical protein [Achromobacter insolitus]|uniref:hypothetical protein n=1 Tax=Achromobacter insolitus TaxID=217204 RepID=UPI0028A97305|nr:hypothetical protein [Achromobacter insolitus]
MCDEKNSADAKEPSKPSGIDPAALVLAALASTVSMLMATGTTAEYTVTSLAIGLTLTCVIYAYDVKPKRTCLQKIAISMVVAFTATMAVGGAVAFLTACQPKPISRIPFEAYCWAVLTFVAWLIESNRNEQKVP